MKNNSIAPYLTGLATEIAQIEKTLLLPFYQIDTFIEANEETLQASNLSPLNRKRMKLAEVITTFYEFKEVVEKELGEKLEDWDKKYNPTLIEE